MNIADIAANAGAATSGAARDQATLIDNYDAFLQLLTTQLRNQSPLEPLDTNQFTQQLVQFSSVEQAIRTNQSMEQLISVTAAANATSLLGYIGTEILAEGAVTQLKNGNAEWEYTAAGDGEADIMIRNAAGQVVWQDTQTIAAGTHEYQWTGRMADGRMAPEGAYSMSIAAVNEDGLFVDVETRVGGTVDGIDLTGEEPFLKIGDMTLPLSAVRSVASRS